MTVPAIAGPAADSSADALSRLLAEPAVLAASWVGDPPAAAVALLLVTLGLLALSNRAEPARLQHDR